MTNEQTMTAFTSGIIGGLVVRSVTVAAGIAVAILLLAALFSAPIPATAGADTVRHEPAAPMLHAAQDARIIIR